MDCALAVEMKISVLVPLDSEEYYSRVSRRCLSRRVILIKGGMSAL